MLPPGKSLTSMEAALAKLNDTTLKAAGVHATSTRSKEKRQVSPGVWSLLPVLCSTSRSHSRRDDCARDA